MEGIFNRRIKRLITCLLLMGSFNLLSAGTFEWTGEKYIGNWNGSSSYGEGWSEWSANKPTGDNLTMYVKAKVYMKAINWSSESCTEATQDPITVGSTVRQNNRNYTKYNDSWTETYSYCSDRTGVRQSSYDAGCNCALDTSDPTAYCTKSGGSGYCANQSQLCGTPTYTQQCYWIKCGNNVTGSNKHCNGGFTSGSNHGCGSQDWHCYKTSSTFESKYDKSKWHKSLSEAGGYAKEEYIYSYPTRVYIDYNANGTDKICGNGETASWSNGSNSDNANSGIKYVDGNPVCSTSFTTNTMKSSYIDYANGGNLKANQYYKIGSDFKGWSLTPNGPVLFNKDGQKVTSQQLKARPGERITLYAQWQKHNYKVTYSYLCGNIQNVTYKYGEGVDLDDLNTTSCKTNNPNSNASFLGWYEDIGYAKRLKKIPTSYYRDITLYAKIRETRFFNYKTGSWEYTK